MRNAIEFPITFPIKGVVKNRGYHDQPEGTTPDAKNVWPFQWTSGRGRGGTRPGRTAVTSPYNGELYHAGYVNFVEANVLYNGIGVLTQAGLYVSYDGYSNWSQRTNASIPNDFASFTMFDGKYVIASFGTQYLKYLTATYTGGATGGTSVIDSASEPQYSGIVVTWNGRLVVAGNRASPQTLYASKIGSFNQAGDWDTTDVAADAAYTNSGDESGQISEPITSLIPHNRDCLIVGCRDSMYVIRGNPKAGGQIYKLSSTVGPLMQSAWCKDSADNTWMITRQGLSKIPAGCGQPPVDVSKGIIPNELVGLDPGVHGSSSVKFTLLYDDRYQGLHILGGDQVTPYFYDMQAGGFWPMEYAYTGGAAEAAKFGWTYPRISDSTRGSAVLSNWGNDAWVLDTDDTSESVDSYLWLGPIPIGEPGSEGILSSVQAILAEDSGEIGWEVYIGNSAQEAFNSDPAFTGSSWDRQALNFKQYPRVRGSVFYLKLFDINNSKWSVEEVLARIATTTRNRRVGGA